MTTSLKKMKTGLGSDPVYEITVEHYKTNTDGVHNYRDVYGYVTNISINNGNVFFNYKTKSIFNNSTIDPNLIFGEGTINGSDLHTSIELQEIDSINIENTGY